YACTNDGNLVDIGGVDIDVPVQEELGDLVVGLSDRQHQRVAAHIVSGVIGVLRECKRET
uniref:Transcriptional regulator n=1 Tax=Macrostomum lignano TaxID=282301 RepID=A0A1I8GGI0_9PLAT